jgi:hypothetical protein
MCARILWWFGGAPSSGFSRHMNLNRSWMMLVGWANKMMILFIAKERGKLQPFCHWWCYFIFSVFGHKVYQACFVTHPKLMTPPPHDSPPNPILPYFQYMQLTLVTPKRVRSCVETQIFGSEVGGHMGWGRNGHAFHAHPLLFQPLFILETIINPYKLILPSIESPEGGQ